MSPANRLAAGLRALPATAKAFASTQAAWRFLHNERITLPQLARPLVAAAAAGAKTRCDNFVLVVHDWCQLHYNGHAGKKDRVELSQSSDMGYELQTMLLVGDRDGDPLGVGGLSLRAADGVHCSRQARVRPPLSQLDELAPAMEFIERQQLAKPVVHVIDAEADSVGHYREWIKKPGRLFVVRADAERVAEHEAEKRPFSAIRQRCREQGAFRFSREVLYRGGTAQQWVAEVEVVLTQPARPHRRGEPRRVIHGPPVKLRLIISEVRDDSGRTLAVWFLLTNAPAAVVAETIALWYYWRWQIESYFKLLKSAGQELEHWQQENADAILRRLLVASMACLVVWQLMRDNTPKSAETRELLVRLSGRQMKRGKPYTAPALLAGLWVLLNILYVLENYQLEDLRNIAESVFTRLHTGPP